MRWWPAVFHLHQENRLNLFLHTRFGQKGETPIHKWPMKDIAHLHERVLKDRYVSSLVGSFIHEKGRAYNDMRKWVHEFWHEQVEWWAQSVASTCRPCLMWFFYYPVTLKLATNPLDGEKTNMRKSSVFKVNFEIITPLKTWTGSLYWKSIKHSIPKCI